jgi:L-ribulose-5-phosphate 3-epimerase
VRFGVNTYSYIYSHSALDCIRHLADLGYTRFELMAFPGHIWPGECTTSASAALRSCTRENRLQITTLNQPNIDINLAGATQEMRAYSVGVIERIIELASDIECGAVIIGPGKANPLLQAPKDILVGRFHEALDSLLPRADALGVQILVENMPFAFLPDAKSLMASLDYYGSSSIGTVYDIANAAFINEDVVAGLETMRPRLKFVHVSDTPSSIYGHRIVTCEGGIVPFARLADPLRALALPTMPILEIISSSPDHDIAESSRRLIGMGWTMPPAQPRPRPENGEAPD